MKHKQNTNKTGRAETQGYRQPRKKKAKEDPSEVEVLGQREAPAGSTTGLICLHDILSFERGWGGQEEGGGARGLPELIATTAMWESQGFLCCKRHYYRSIQYDA